MKGIRPGHSFEILSDGTKKTNMIRGLLTLFIFQVNDVLYSLFR